MTLKRLMSRTEENLRPRVVAYLAIALTLGLLAAVAYWKWPRPPREEEVVRREIPISSIPPYVSPPVSKVSFPALPPASRGQLVSGHFEAGFDVDQLPKAIKEFYGIGNDSPLSGMANPGQRFNISDSVDEKLPMMRLVFAAVRHEDSFWIVHYEYGGRTHGYQVHFLNATAGSVIPVWSCSLSQPAVDIQILQSKVRDGTCKGPG